jgi:hypothetical protein
MGRWTRERERTEERRKKMRREGVGREEEIWKKIERFKRK